MAISVPTDIAGCEVWLDADDGATFTFGTGTEVQQWNDKSGNARHFNDEGGGSSQQPERQASILNGRHAVVWDASEQRLATSWTQSQPFTVFVLCQWSSDGQYAYVVDASSGISIGRRDSDVCRVDADGGAFPSDTFAVLQDTPYYITAVFSGAASDARLNGVAKFTNLDIGSAGVTGSLRLGRQSGGSGLGQTGGYIAEFVVYDTALSAGDITDVEDYLVAKWFAAPGLTVPVLQPQPQRNVHRM